MHARFDKISPGIIAKLHFLSDLTFVVVALMLSLGGRVALGHPQATLLAGVAIASWFCAAAVLRLYSPCTPRRQIDRFVLHVVAALATVMTTGTVYLTLADGSLVLDPLRWIALLSTAGLVTTLLFRILKPLETKISAPEDHVLIVGTGSMGVTTYKRLVAHANVVGFVHLEGQPEQLPELDVPVFGGSDMLGEVLSEFPVDEVYIAGRVIEQGAEMQQVVRACEEVGVPFALPLHSLRFERALLLSSSPARDGYLHYLTTPSHPVQYGVKRLLDISASMVALFLLAPFLVVVAALIKLTSSGPVFFRQVRVGLHGARFNLLKFRSMVTDAEALKEKLSAQNEQSGPVFKMKHDPRITRIGRFIRKYSIDELPQLINVLRGDMTLVGPRPAIPKEVAQYKAWQRRRLSVRPGLTCYWQVGGRNEIGFEDWMRMDLRYVDNWSLGIDLQLILQTFPVVFTGKGAS